VESVHWTVAQRRHGEGSERGRAPSQRAHSGAGRQPAERPGQAVQRAHAGELRHPLGIAVAVVVDLALHLVHARPLQKDRREGAYLVEEVQRVAPFSGDGLWGHVRTARP
jgi:hypothetical protein